MAPHLRSRPRALPCPEHPGRLIQTGMALASAAALLLAASCGGDDPVQPTPVSGEEEEQVKAALQDRSFRQFDPSLDASPRKGVVLDFFEGVSLWAQYAEDEHAVNEWQVSAGDYRLEKAGNAKFQEAEFVIRFEEPESSQLFPEECSSCIPTEGFSISVRNVFDGERISFRLNDDENQLPPPFPVFGSWTRFREDEYFE